MNQHNFFIRLVAWSTLGLSLFVFNPFDDYQLASENGKENQPTQEIDKKSANEPKLKIAQAN